MSKNRLLTNIRFYSDGTRTEVSLMFPAEEAKSRYNKFETTPVKSPENRHDGKH